MKRFLGTGLIILLLGTTSFAETPEISSTKSEQAKTYTLAELMDAALKNNPSLLASKRNIEAEEYRVDIAKAERLPVINLNGGVTHSRYPQAVTPISGSPLTTKFPEFDETIYDVSVSLSLPLYRGGRIERGITIAEIRKDAAKDTFSKNRQELVYNIRSVFYKISHLEKLRESTEAEVKQLQEHRNNVELSVNTGTAPRVDLLKTDVELSHARQNALLIKNSIESAYEFLKTLVGFEDDSRLKIAGEERQADLRQRLDESISIALAQRPDYKAIQKKKKIAEQSVLVAQGRRHPQVSLNSEYGERSGADLGFNENWAVGLRFTLPLFDGGLIKSEIEKERKAAEITKEEERALRNQIIREVKEAYLNIENSNERIAAASTTIDAAKENLRIENLKYRTGTGTSTDVIDAQAGLLRAESEYYQAVFDKEAALSLLKKAIGEDQ
ncbi:MAG: TolC family protein [Deltaproteobacteria bacterium]|nr:TolC family protein [Deltaproteobacteria bacterium]